MTLEEYKASPSSWNPTFTVATLADYTKWQNRTAGNDYERVKVAGNVTATAGIDLSYSQTKQVVFNDGVTLTLELDEAEGRCFYRSLKEAGAELWMYKPRISAQNTQLAGDIYGFYFCNNIESPVIVALRSGTGRAGNIGGASGTVYCFHSCNSIASPAVESATGGNGGASTSAAVTSAYTGGAGGTVYCFHSCNNIASPAVKSATGGNGGTFHASNTSGKSGAGGAVYGFYSCNSIASPAVESATGGAAGDKPYSGVGSVGSAGKVFCFYYCENVADPKATVASGANSVYMNYYWSGLIINRAGSVAKTALFNPSYGPYYLLLSDEPRPGMPVALSWAFINSDGTSVSKSAGLSVTFDGGATWTSIYTGTNTSYTYTVPSGKESVKFRVGSGTSTGYCSSDAVPFTAAPVISGTDTNLGVMADAFAPYAYSIAKSSTDTEEWNEAAVTVTLDGKTLQSFRLALNAAKTVLIGAAEWKKVPNGEHTVKISARRIVSGVSFGTAAVRTLAFTRTKNRAVLTLRNAARPDAKPAQIMLSVTGAFPSGSSLKAGARNNASDPAPAREDMTAKRLAGTPHAFSNGTKTAGEWGVNFRVTLERKTATGDCCINAVSGEYS